MTADLLTVIRDPHNWRGVMDASTYKVPKTLGAQVLHNDAGILSAVASDSAGGEDERLLIVKQYELTVVQIYEQYNVRVAYTTEVAPKRRTSHACYNSETNAAYLLGFIDDQKQIFLTKYSIDQMQ